jgi:demethylmenaquinone methyltransferase/2-methoxy-6-polyprenyl-1,4-benzoquinol methylase
MSTASTADAPAGPSDPGASGDPGGTTDFGYDRVPLEAKAGAVGKVFDSVAPRYDLMNDLMSGGLHRLWKAALIDRLRPRPGMSLADLAGGTGDVAFRFFDRLGEEPGRAGAVIVDRNPSMLAIAQDRAVDRGLLRGLGLVCADAASLPFPSGAFDGCTIAFGLRNVTRRRDALAEARRILRPGGHFLCLEFSPGVLPLLRPLYDLYSFRVLPALGQAVAGDAESYRYLAESIRRFPDQETLAAEMREEGFDNVTWRNLSAGIVALHSGWRI